MQVGLKRGAPAKARASFLCVPLFEGESLKNGWIGDLDAASGGVVAALARAGDFTGRFGTQTLLYNPEASGPKRIHVIGAGNPDQLDLERIRQTASRAVKRAAELNLQDVTILFPTRISLPAYDVAVALTEGCILGDYKFDRYVTSRDAPARRIDEVTLLLATDADAGAVQQGIARGSILADAVCRVRDMVNAPGNELTPTEMANRAAASAKQFGYRAEIFERRDMQRLGMGGILAVSQGSEQPPRFIVLEYDGADAKAAPFVVVGKGLTFDAGGICLKPAAKMDEMKGDMAGGAAVIGAVEAAARLKIPARVVGLVPATENLLGGAAYRPGDILKFANGKTVFIDNTDAEGRLVLADALVYADRYKPRSIVDLATLTGAVLVALGQVATAVLGNDRDLIQSLLASGERTFERLWELPLWEEFDELIKSPIADIKNTGGKNGGTITAAAFLRHFVGTTPWAHLDVAGTSYLDKAEGYRPAGGTGVGVRLLIDFFETAAPKDSRPKKNLEAPARRGAPGVRAVATTAASKRDSHRVRR